MDGRHHAFEAALVSGAPGSARHQPGLRAKRAYLEFKAQSNPGAWCFRGYLPHRDEIGLIQSLTFRLADSLPQSKLRELEKELKDLPADKQTVERRRQIETLLDAGMGCCALRHPALARVLTTGFLRNDGVRYRLLAWCVMPNHVHVLLHPLVPLAKILGSWKSYNGRWALAHNASLKLGITGKSLWQREVWDRYMRDERHLSGTVEYIHHNPVKAGLCKRPEDWRWSSAWKERSTPGAPGTGPA